MRLVHIDAPDLCLVPLLAPDVAAESDGANELPVCKSAQNIVFSARPSQALSKHVDRGSAVFLRGFAESAGLALQSLQAQLPKLGGILRCKGPNLYSHLEASVAVILPCRFPLRRAFRFSRCVKITLLFAATGAGALWPQDSPDAATQQKVLADARNYAGNRERSLPDFICTQTTRRFANVTGQDGDWRPLDIIVERLTYFEHHEDYRVLEINGVASSIAHDKLTGASSSGEFGSVMKGIFAPVAATEFHWQTYFTLRGQRMHVYAYQVAKANSDYHIMVPGLTPAKTMDLVAGYHGLVFIDDKQHYIHRITLHADGIPPAYPVQDVSLMLDYDDTRIGDADYLLPLNFELRSREGKTMIKNDVDYEDYRKFTADSNIQFGDAEPSSNGAPQPAGGVK